HHGARLAHQRLHRRPDQETESLGASPFRSKTWTSRAAISSTSWVSRPPPRPRRRQPGTSTPRRPHPPRRRIGGRSSTTTSGAPRRCSAISSSPPTNTPAAPRSEEHTSELQSLTNL